MGMDPLAGTWGPTVANDAENALCALREATAALGTATTRGPGGAGGVDEAVLVAELTRHLQVLARLVRASLAPVPTTSAGHDLHAVVQGITAAEARRSAGTDGHRPAPPLLAAGRPSTAPDD